MLPEKLRSRSAERLVENLRKYQNHLTTGFLGTPYLCHVLSRFGYTDIAYKVLKKETYPSWLYPVKMGATTIWERWDGIKSDGSFQTPEMNSFNHYAYGAIGEWMYGNIAGINSDEASLGYKKIRIKPRPGGGLTHARGELDTYYGKIVSKWNLENGKLFMEVEIPTNTEALVCLPASGVDKITEGGKPVSSLKDIKFTDTEEEDVILKVGSGKYKFSTESNMNDTGIDPNEYTGTYEMENHFFNSINITFYGSDLIISTEFFCRNTGGKPPIKINSPMTLHLLPSIVMKMAK